MQNPNETKALEDMGIVRPVVTRNSPKLGPLAVLVAPGGDYHTLKTRPMALDWDIDRTLYLGNLFGKTGVFSIAGPLMGAPYAVMVLETLVAWGASRFLFYGWCGGIGEALQPGDVIVPNAAFVDEGTSTHYGQAAGDCVQAASANREIKRLLVDGGMAFSEGLIWTTDAIYRETPSKIRQFQERGALGVEMEVSALFSAARYLNVDLGAMLLVSDRVSPIRWQPGFRDPAFLESRSRLLERIAIWCHQP
ncbi:nucleoside phosphorylase [Desulfatirhabdium butyrativorans]|uniref:nucleoside phosphorylase n=1 Tax=Desulfatirhabdium butyrativorans TaxID=340467 RepID=UPI000421C72B|nr:nucleoside phosphorylase [Desulfatirhabdium butyrativorans]